MNGALCGLVVAALVAASPLTPEEAVKIALERSGQVTAARLDAQVKALERGLELEPLELRLGHRALDGWFGEPYAEDGQTYATFDDTYAALRFSPPKPAELAELWAEASRAEADGLEVEELGRDVAAEVRGLHARVLALRAEEDLLRSALAVAVRLEEQTRVRVSAEAATELDVHLAALERLDAAGDLEEVSNEARRLEHRLAALLAVPAPLSLAAGPELCVAPPADVESVVARAAERSSRLRALEARRKEVGLESALAWAAWMPYVDGLLVGWYDEPLDKRDSLRARLDIALPIFEPFSGRARAAALSAQRIDALRDDARRALDANVRSAVERLQNARDVVRVFEEGQGAIVEKGLADVTLAIEAGQADVLRLAEVQRRALRSRRGLLRAKLRCEEAAIELLRVTGDVVGREPGPGPR